MRIECSKCEDIVDVEARTVVSPFVCKWCEEGFTPKSQRFIVEFQSPYDGMWDRSSNPDTARTFESIDEAFAAIDKETDGLEYRVVPYTPLAFPDKPCIPTSPAVFDGEYVDMEYVLGTDHVYAAVPDATDTQFDFDTEIIEDLETRLSAANAVIKRLETQVDYWREAYCDLAIVRNGLETNLRVEQRKTWWERLWE
jgi:hypothetical protein